MSCEYNQIVTISSKTICFLLVFLCIFAHLSSECRKSACGERIEVNLLAIYVGSSQIAVHAAENWAVCCWFMSNFRPGCILQSADPKSRFADVLLIKLTEPRLLCVALNRWREFYYINIVTEWDTVGQHGKQLKWMPHPISADADPTRKAVLFVSSGSGDFFRPLFGWI